MVSISVRTGNWIWCVPVCMDTRMGRQHHRVPREVVEPPRWRPSKRGAPRPSPGCARGETREMHLPSCRSVERNSEKEKEGGRGRTDGQTDTHTAMNGPLPRAQVPQAGAAAHRGPSWQERSVAGGRTAWSHKPQPGAGRAAGLTSSGPLPRAHPLVNSRPALESVFQSNPEQIPQMKVLFLGGEGGGRGAEGGRALAVSTR